MVDWRNRPKVLGVTESALVKLLKYAPWSGEVDELAQLIDATPARTWVAVARLAERGLVFAEAGTTTGEIRARLTAQASRRLPGFQLTGQEKLWAPKRSPGATRATITRTKSA